MEEKRLYFKAWLQAENKKKKGGNSSPLLLHLDGKVTEENWV